MTQTTVLCHCCGHHMVPQVVRSRGIYVGWEWGGRIGAGHPIDSVCPFCLSSNWDGVQRPEHHGPAYKLGLIVALAFVGAIFLAIIEGLYEVTNHRQAFKEFEPFINWAVLGLGVLIYRAKRFKKK